MTRALAAWDALLSFQESKNISGNCLEIGVWRGKTAAVMLNHTKPENEKLYLIDINLQMDELNKNLALVNKNHNNIVYHEASSFGLEHKEFPSSS